MTVFVARYDGWRMVANPEGLPRYVALDLMADLDQLSSIIRLLQRQWPRSPFPCLIRSANPDMLGGVRLRVLLAEFGASGDGMAYVSVAPLDKNLGELLMPLQRLVHQPVQVEFGAAEPEEVQD